MDTLFADRSQAGRLLAAALKREPLIAGPFVVVLALPRGGVPVGYEVASALDAPLSVFIVRKLGVPGHRELAMGAIASGDVRVLDDDLIDTLGIPAYAVEQITAEERAELHRREQSYRTDAPMPSLVDRTVVLVDDGLATGSTMKAAVRAVRAQNPRHVVVAVPVGAAETCAALAREADRVVCLRTPEPFRAVGLWYVNFAQTTDEEVRALLRAAAQRHAVKR